MKKYLAAAILPFALFLFSCSSTDSPAVPSESKTVFVSSFQNGLLPYASYNGCFDTMLVEYDPATPYYTTTNIIAGQISQGKIRTLIRFNLSSLDPNTVKVKAAYLKLTNYYGGGTFKACRMTSSWSALSDWNTSDSITGWTTLGGDYTDTANSGWTAIPYTNAELIFKLDNAMVESWINDSINNYGVIIIGQNENTTDYLEEDFVSSDSAPPYSRPVLTIYYTL